MKSESVKKPKKLKSVKNAMWGYFCLLAFLLVLLVELVFFLIVSGTLENQAKEKITHIGHELEDGINFRPDRVEDSVMRYRREGIYVILMTEAGDVIAPKDF